MADFRERLAEALGGRDRGGLERLVRMECRNLNQLGAFVHDLAGCV